MNGWVSALWDIRQDRGQDFTDRALMYSLKAPVDSSEDMNKYFSDRFRGGVLVVKNVERIPAEGAARQTL